MEETPKEGVNQPSAGPTEEKVEKEETTPQMKPGDKTDPNLLLKSLQEERVKRQQLEERLNKLESSIPSDKPEEDEFLSDEAKLLKKEIGSLKETIQSMEERQNLKDLYGQFPVLKDKTSEFDEFRKEYPHHKLENVAKIFMAEQGLLEVPPQRKGLEKPTGGTRTPQPQEGYTPEEARDIRVNNPKLYEKLVREQRLKIVSSK